MMLALVGASGTGKSTVARELSIQLSWPVRYCGDEVRCMARQQGVQPEALSLRAHADVDEATRLMARQVEPLIVEGRFLHYVLAALSPGSLTLVRLEASAEVRASRLLERGNPKADTSLVTDADRQDNEFVSAMYSGTSPRGATLTIATDSLSALEVVDRICRASGAAPL